VEVAGSWTVDWIPQPCKLNNGIWEINLDLAPGSYEYKYLINGIEFLDSSKPSAKNHHGIVNNILTISGQAKGEITVHHLLPKQVSYSSKDLAEEKKVQVNDKGENEEEKSKVTKERNEETDGKGFDLKEEIYIKATNEVQSLTLDLKNSTLAGPQIKMEDEGSSIKTILEDVVEDFITDNKLPISQDSTANIGLRDDISSSKVFVEEIIPKIFQIQ